MLIVLAQPACKSGSTRDRGKPIRVTSSSGLDIYPSFSPDGQQLAYCSDRGGNFEIYIKRLDQEGQERQLTSDGQQNFQPAWSPDGQQLAYHSKSRGGIWVISASGGEPRQLSDFGSRPAWSRDGANIAFQSEPLVDLGANGFHALPPSTIWVVPSQGGKAKQITRAGEPLGGHGFATWSADGSRIVFLNFNSSRRATELWSMNAEGGDIKRLARDQQYCYDPVYTQDGKGVYYTAISQDEKFGIWRIDMAANGEAVGEPVEVLSLGTEINKQLAISADGKRLAYVTLATSSSLRAVPIAAATALATGEPVELIADASYRSTRPIFSPDGKKIAYVQQQFSNQDIYVIDADGKNRRKLTLDQAADTFPSWYPDSEAIVFLSNRNRRGGWTIWSNALKAGEDRLLADINQDIDQARVSPDGKEIAFNSKKGGEAINVWVAPISGGEPRQLTFDKEFAGFPAWSPDGKFISFEIKRGNDQHIAIVPSTGGEITQLTFDQGQSWPYSWSPDGDKIAYAALRNGLWNVWWVSRATKATRQVTNYSKLHSYVRYPSWSPLNNQIVFEYAETTGSIWMIER